MHTRAVILAGGEGTRLGVLTAKRTKPAVPFAGKYRIIDFPLSNCVNSNIFDVMLVTQYLPQSLITHIGAGGPWDLNREFSGGVQIFTPYKAKSANWFSGTADAIYQNLNFITRNDPDHLLILSGDHVYSMNFQQMIRFHEENDADVTICVRQVPKKQASRFGVLTTNENMHVTSFVEKPEEPPSDLINMGIYVFDRKSLVKYLEKDYKNVTSMHDFGKNILPTMVREKARVFAFQFQEYWVDVGTIQSYWKAHMDLLSIPPVYDIRNRYWVIHTRSEERPPAFIHSKAKIKNSLICDGCIIEPGVEIKNSVISPGVRIKRGSCIDSSIILTDTEIESNCSITKTIIDKRAHIMHSVTIGMDRSEKSRISMIGKNAIVPSHIAIQHGGMIGCDVSPADFKDEIIHFGEIVIPK